MESFAYYLTHDQQRKPVNWLVNGSAGRLGLQPIVQIIDDDKGVHYCGGRQFVMKRSEMCLLGLKVCRIGGERVGATVGGSDWPNLCGVTGCSRHAAKDITGPGGPSGQADALALSKRVNFAIDRPFITTQYATHMTLCQLPSSPQRYFDQSRYT
jgi:hypothetical protein